MPKAKHPSQPLVFDKGVIRFKSNGIIRWLVDTGRTNMNELALQNFSAEDRDQFAQLIGYSVSGYGELDYVPDAEVARADRAAKRLMAKRRKK